MRISPGEEYGLRCLLQLSQEHSSGKSLSLQQIADREGLPVPNTAKLLRKLRMAGIVTSERGRSGGYLLRRAPDRITLAEVQLALDGPVFQPGVDCTSYSGLEATCVHRGDCSVRTLWTALDDLVLGALQKITLADLVTSERRARDHLGAEWTGRVEIRASWVPEARTRGV